MTNIDKIRAEIEQMQVYPCKTDEQSIRNVAFEQALEIIDKYAEQEPCDDCISRELVLRELDKYLCGLPFDEKGIDEVIKDLPGVQPKTEQEPKTGHWLFPYGDKRYKKCSACGRIYYSIPHDSNYCPNCGCKMESEV